MIIVVFFRFILIFFIIYNQFLYILEKQWLALGRNVKITCDNDADAFLISKLKEAFKRHFVKVH